MDRYSRKDAEKAFERLIAAIGGRVAVDYKDIGAYRLDWNSTYGGGNIERVISAGGGVTQPLGGGRMNAKDFCNTVHFTINAMGEKERIATSYSVADIRSGTGFAKGQRFVALPL